MRQAQINVRTRACSRTSIARTKQAALTHNVRGKELRELVLCYHSNNDTMITCMCILSGGRYDTITRIVARKRNPSSIQIVSLFLPTHFSYFNKVL